ncbi:MAG TPA: replication-associated recombination protein A [Proteobacteria bacterium]|nr:replication-associated recombination protein A [Pseudomonadota bacterium]
MNSSLISPLAHRLRPQNFEEFVGQSHLLAGEGVVARQLQMKRLDSMIFWGPPGCGKTTLANLLAGFVEADFHKLSAVTAGVAEVRKLAEIGRANQLSGRRTVLFLDEIHRFNKVQQDFLLAPVEEGSLILLGATTENPSFSIITPLLSRARVAVLKALTVDDIKLLLERAVLCLNRDQGRDLQVEAQVLGLIAAYAEGDARRALNLLDSACLNLLPETADGVLRVAALAPLLGDRKLDYDRDGEEHFNQISAFIKSMRAGDPDAALYWLGRMLKAGEDPLYCARRMIRFASEDVGNAAPQALQLTINARQAYETLGSPEGELALYQAAVYLATAPKSDAVYQAVKRIEREIRASGSLPVPLQVRNAPTKLLRDLGYGRSYVNPHRDPGNQLLIKALPEGLTQLPFYRPSGQGYELTIRQRQEARNRQARGNTGETAVDRSEK